MSCVNHKNIISVVTDGVVCLIMCCFSFYVSAQESITFQHYSAMDGLPDNRVNSIIQDKEGFIWIGTNGGLCRFDGHEFLKYYYDAKNPNSVSGNYIKDLAEHSDGTLWIATGDGGICSLSKDRKKFTRYYSDTLYKVSVNINCITLSKNERRVYIGMENGGLHYLDVATGVISPALPPSSPNSSSVYDILEESDDMIYYGQSAYGMRRLNKGISEESKIDLSYPHPAYTISCFYRDSDKNIWMGAWSDRLFKLNSYDEYPEEFALYGNKIPNLSGNEIICINESADKKLWLGTKLGGLFIFDRNTSQFSQYEANRSNPLSLKGNAIFSIFRDKSNRMWIGTEEGVNIYDPALNKFEINYLNYENYCKIHCFLQEGDSLYIGTDKGIYLKHTNGETSHYPIERFNKNENVRSLFRDSRGRLWIGTQNGIYHWNDRIKNIERIPNAVHKNIDHNHISSSYVTKILEYPLNGKPCIWAFVLGYGCLIFPDDHSSFAFVPSTQNSFENLVRNVYVDKENRMWITGAILGASIVQPNTKELLPNRTERLQIIPVSSQKIETTNAYDFIEVNGKYWFGSRGRGLVHLPLAEGEPALTVPDKMPRNIQGINSDKSGNIWFLSSQGIGKFSPSNNSIRFFDDRSGVATQGLAGFIYKDNKEQLYCGGNGFYIKFRPEEVQASTEVPRLIFTHFQVMDQPSDSLLSSSHIYLDHLENTIKITTTSLNFTNPTLTEYLYKLEGLYDEWISNGFDNEITFTGLPPGDYTLNVLSKNSAGLMSETAAVLRFTISPPFYKTWLFYIVMFLIVAAIAFVFYQNRVRQLMAILKMRNKIARDLHDDVGSTLGSISIYSEAIKQQLKGKMNESAAATLEKIGNSSRLMIEQMSDIVWSVDPQHDTMEHLVERMQNFGSDLFATTHMHFTLNVEKECFSKKLDMEERKSIFLIYKEALYNSLKYSGGSEINVSLNTIDGHVTLHITDNGKGFNHENAYSYNGNGLRNMAFRAKNIGAILKIHSEEGWGTDISLIIK